MTIKSILVPLSGAHPAETTLKAAITIAASHQAHIDVLHVHPNLRMISAIYTESGSAPNVEELIRRSEEKAAKNTRNARAAFDKFCKLNGLNYSATKPQVEGVTISWHEEVGYENEWVQHYGRVADLIVFAHPVVTGVSASLSLETALTDSGRPVLIIPPVSPTHIGSNIAIAWNDSVEAARAVGEARAFLAAAKKVTILNAAEPDRSQFNIESLRRLLEWHGASADIKQVASEGNIGKALLSAAEECGADLFVMGAYSHNRLRQLIFGGVTRHVLESATLPVFMMH